MPNVVKGKISDRIRKAYLTQKRRRDYPKSYFLLPEERKFPYRDPDSGAIHCGLVRAAITRAAQYGYRSIEEKARNIYTKYCKETVKKDFEPILKDAEGKEVFGAVLVPGKEDMDGHTFTEEEIRKMCYEFNIAFQQLGYRHLFLLNEGEAQILESYLLPVDAEISLPDGETKSYPKGTWMLRARVVDPDLARRIASGEVVGWSIGGVMFKEESDG